MSKKKIINVATFLNVNMPKIENTKFLTKWKVSKKEQKRITIMQEALDFAEQRAFNDFGIIQSSLSMEVSKLILIAKDCLEKQEKE